ncbi:MAG: hypothetical protein KAJ73_06885, partial [Zetaproteobacteria bacterium]|nr:hypothetical protein [Zetaproteobacteria bacterium]
RSTGTNGQWRVSSQPNMDIIEVVGSHFTVELYIWNRGTSGKELFLQIGNIYKAVESLPGKL